MKEYEISEEIKKKIEEKIKEIFPYSYMLEYEQEWVEEYKNGKIFIGEIEKEIIDNDTEIKERIIKNNKKYMEYDILLINKNLYAETVEKETDTDFNDGFAEIEETWWYYLAIKEGEIFFIIRKIRVYKYSCEDYERKHEKVEHEVINLGEIYPKQKR